MADKSIALSAQQIEEALTLAKSIETGKITVTFSADALYQGATINFAKVHSNPVCQLTLQSQNPTHAVILQITSIDNTHCTIRVLTADYGLQTEGTTIKQGSKFTVHYTII